MTIYDDLIKRLREASKMSEALAVLLPNSDGSATAKLYNEAADAIEKLCNLCANQSKDCSEAVAKYLELWEKQPRWIPVTERLPDMHVEVLVCTEDYGKTELGFSTCAVWDETGWLETWERKTYLTAVTHWMPIPEPPKEET